MSVEKKSKLFSSSDNNRPDIAMKFIFKLKCLRVCVCVCVCMSEWKRETEFEQFSRNFLYVGGFPGGSNGKESACNAGDQLF